jgi:hypothetical protein
MPMSFPDMESLKRRAEQRGFRQPNENELEFQFRKEFADFMENIDMVESMEIRTSKGWDEFNERQKINLLERKMGTGNLFKIFVDTAE